MTIQRIIVLLVLAAILFGFGIVAPCLIIYPAAGEFTHLLKILTPQFGNPREVSIAGGIYNLLSGEGVLIGIILLLFSVLFPLLKLGVLWAATQNLRRGVREPGLMHLVEKIGRFSMLDILVLALLVMVVKKLPGETQVTIGPGVAAFTGAALLSLITPIFLREINTLPPSK